MFPRPLRESDPGFLRAATDRAEAAQRLADLHSRISELKDERKDAAAEYTEIIKALEPWEKILDRIYAHQEILEGIEEARLRSIESPESVWVAYAVPPMDASHPQWLKIDTRAAAEGDERGYPDRYVEFGRFLAGGQVGLKDKPEAPAKAKREVA